MFGHHTENVCTKVEFLERTRSRASSAAPRVYHAGLIVAAEMHPPHAEQTHRGSPRRCVPPRGPYVSVASSANAAGAPDLSLPISIQTRQSQKFAARFVPNGAFRATSGNGRSIPMAALIITGRSLSTAEVDAPGKTLDVRQGRPDRSVKFIQLHVGGDETVALIQANSGSDESAVDIDDVGLQHGGSFRDRGQGCAGGLGSR